MEKIISRLALHGKKINLSSIAKLAKELFDGSILMRGFVVKHYGLLFFVAVLSIIYITTRYRYNQNMRQNSELQQSVDSLRFVFMEEHSRYMTMSRESNVEEQVMKNIPGLNVCHTPPIEVKE